MAMREAWEMREARLTVGERGCCCCCCARELREELTKEKAAELGGETRLLFVVVDWEDWR